MQLLAGARNRAIEPTLIVALGTTALSALMGSALTLKAARESKLEHPSGACVFATYHPSAILRAPTVLRDDLLEMLCDDLRKAARLAKQGLVVSDRPARGTPPSSKGFRSITLYILWSNGARRSRPHPWASVNGYTAAARRCSATP